MKGVHEDDVGSTYLYAVYNCGNIVRLRNAWGVITNNGGRYGHPSPYVTWLDDNDYAGASTWTTAQRCLDAALSAPYTHTYEGIPDEVLAKATEIMLLGD